MRGIIEEPTGLRYVGDRHAVQCVVEAALRTERTSMGFAPGAELSVL